MSDLEEQKKLLLPILQRAEELQPLEPRMAYYCRLYAIKKGLEIPKPSKEISGLIRATFAQCEKDKASVKPNEEDDRVYCENFALTVFRRADKVDRAGRADMNTCKAYYAAAIFMQVCEQFLTPGEELEEAAPDIVEKTRYALWRAAEIRKALREGRQPTAPPDASTMPSAAAANSSAAAGDMFAGPSYEQSVPEQQMPQPPMPAPEPTATDSIASSTDEFLALPRPPSTVPPQGSTGLLAPAAAAGPRYRPGSRVWCVTASGLGSPEEGTVGMVLSPAGGPGGQAVYKVALRDRLEELSDSQLAPAVTAGARVLHVAAFGEQPEAASVIAANAENWPCMYLLQLDNGSNLQVDGSHISQAAPGDARGRPPPTQQPAGAYPSVGVSRVTGSAVPPAAPPLADSHPPAAPSPGAAPPRQQAAAPAAAPVAPPEQQPATGGHGHPACPEVGGAGHSSSSGGGGQQPGPLYGGRAPAAAAGHAPHQAPYQATSHQKAAAAHVQPVAAYCAPAVQPASDFKPSSSAIAEAQKYAKYAASSLAFDDVAGGVKYLTDALRLLTQPPSK